MARLHDFFGRAVAVVTNLLDPDVIVVGGGPAGMRVAATAGEDFVADDQCRRGDASGLAHVRSLNPAFAGP